jgi:hypothetical protein
MNRIVYLALKGDELKQPTESYLNVFGFRAVPGKGR